MNELIQYRKADNTWSNWVSSTFENGHFMVDSQALDNTYVRVLKDKNPENPNVSWFIIHENNLYEATKSKTGFINKAIAIENKSLNPIAIEKCLGDFSLKAFDDMLQSAKDELAPPLFTLTDIQERIMRPADTARTMNLMQAETSGERIENWWKALYEHYRQDVEQQLTAILKQPFTRRQQIEALQHFLTDHHTIIQGTSLDYLAIPNHPVTQTLSYIAERLAAETGLPAIQWLLPGVAMESIKDEHVNLSDLALQDVLNSHIELSPQYFMPVRCLNEYIKEPNAPLFSPYCFDDYRPREATPEDIQALFNHSQTTQQLRDAFQTYQVLLHNQDNLLGQLHILGFKLKLNDAHGGKGRSDDAAMGAYPAIMDFMNYYTLLEPCSLQMKETPPELADLPHGQHIGYVFYQNQLYFINGYENQITPITNPEHPAKFSVHLARFGSLADVPQDIALPVIVKTNDGHFTFFPGQITLDSSMVRCMDINFPNEYHRVINLSESNIPKTVFDAIAKTGFEAPIFAELFLQRFPQSQDLSSEDLAFIDVHTEHAFMAGYAKVPKDLRQEIELLWQLLHNPAKNIEATRNMATCIGTRGEAIRSLTKEYEAELCQIGMHPEKQLQLLQEAKSVLDTQLEELTSKPHPGCDAHLGLTLPILERYHQTMTIQSFADCYLLNGFQPKDLKVLLDNSPNLVNQLKVQLNQTENFIAYLSETPIQILEVILPYNLDYFKIILPFFEELPGLLGTEKYDFLWSQLLNSIQTAQDFRDVVVDLCTSQEPLEKLLTACADRLPSMIQTAQDFRDASYNLSPEEHKQIMNACKDRLPSMIKTAKDLSDVIHFLPQEQLKEVFDACKDRLPGMIKTAKDLGNIVHLFSQEQRKEVLGLCKDRLPDIMQTVQHFRDIVIYLSQEQIAEVFNAYQDRLPGIIQTTKDYCDLVFGLPQEQKIKFIQELEGYWLTKISVSKGNQTFLETIETLCAFPESNIWGHPDLQQSINQLSNALHQLGNYCSPHAIEKFIAALISKDPTQIEGGIKQLLDSKQASKKSLFYFMCQSINPEKEIMMIIHQQLPNFCKQYISPPDAQLTPETKGPKSFR